MSEVENETALRLELARQIAHEAGQLTLQYFCGPDLTVDRKQDATPVTVADREAEQLLRHRISESFPDDGIVGEEFEEKKGSSAFRWLLDPIDGTKSFISGVPLYGTMVAVMRGAEPELGVIEIPPLGESIHAARGGGAWHKVGENRPVRACVSPVAVLSEGLFCTTQLSSFAGSQRADVFTRLQGRARLTRTWGDCYGYLLVATGRAELMVDPELNIWDTAALMPIVEEAGGTLTDFSGRRTVLGGEAVATNCRILKEVLELTATA
jgi:histidinol phosphatase-like enzyme (inositol monophosphatase family)